ncbi:MAG: hypothetical protein K8R02_05095 [Anaerohalosphaeraceae bacterium]|nr:hypothetical protein [Anaerohalosphaeraceae bacterium]
MKAFKNNFAAMVLALVLVSACGQICIALQDGIGDPTTPASGRVSGLHRSPNPMAYGSGGNRIITGNVSGGKHFRGSVPYRSESAFGAPLGSGRLNSFMRYSAPVTKPGQLSPQTYYQPSSTVSSIRRSGSSSGLLLYNNVTTNRATNVSVRKSSNSVLQSISSESSLSAVDDYSIARPLSFTPSDLERMVSYSAEKGRRESELSKALSQAVRNNVSQTPETDELPSDEFKNQSSLQLIDPAKRAERVVADSLSVRPAEVERPAKSFGYSSVYEQMLAEVTPDEQVAEPEPEKATGEDDPARQEQLIKETGNLESEISGISSETAQATVGVHKSFAADSGGKFNYYMRTAEEFLMSGKYYRACDAYTLASIYRPRDPLAYAGRSHALFASGEYMSSAYFLIKAIDIFPDYVKFKIDINAMLPDRDKLESRVADVKEWIEKTESGELSFLLAYIYHQFGQNDFAVAAADFAGEKLPNSFAVKALCEAIKSEAPQN